MCAREAKRTKTTETTSLGGAKAREGRHDAAITWIYSVNFVWRCFSLRVVSPSVAPPARGAKQARVRVCLFSGSILTAEAAAAAAYPRTHHNRRSRSVHSLALPQIAPVCRSASISPRPPRRLLCSQFCLRLLRVVRAHSTAPQPATHTTHTPSRGSDKANEKQTVRHTEEGSTPAAAFRRRARAQGAISSPTSHSCEADSLRVPPFTCAASAPLLSDSPSRCLARSI